jgi:protocatechuate 3,4-dioxygenase beta subunit
MSAEPMNRWVSRRRLLVLGTGALVAAGAGCSDDSRGLNAEEVEPADATLAPQPSTSPAGTPDAGSSTTTTTASPVDASSSGVELTPADFDGVGSCVLTPEQTSGPFYLRTDLVRKDISEGRPGSPLRVGLRVEDAECRPVDQARVDVWHADLFGDYSAYVDGSYEGEEGEGTTFLRGTQFTDTDGLAEFSTIFPGWYPNRALHIHVMVYLGRSKVLTSQMYFSDEVIADVYRAEPYAARGLPDMATNRDRIAGDPVAQGLEMTVRNDAAGRLSLLRLNVAT